MPGMAPKNDSVSCGCDDGAQYSEYITFCSYKTFLENAKNCKVDVGYVHTIFAVACIFQQIPKTEKRCKADDVYVKL